MMDIHKLDLNLLVVLDSLMETGQTTRTAEHLGMSQPSVSYALSKLRASFDDPLFVRDGNGLKPTEKALSLHAPVHRMMQILRNDVARDTNFDPRTSERQFTISMSDIGELVFCPDILALFANEAPNARLRCLSMPPQGLEVALADGTVDLAIGLFPDLNGAGLYQQRLFNHRFACLVREGHPTITTSLSLDAFLAADHVVVLQEGRSQELFEMRLAQLGLSRRVVLQTPHFMSVPYLVATSDVITTVPLAVARACARWAPLRLVECPIATPAIEIRQFWHVRARIDPAISWLRDAVSRRFLGRDPSEEAEHPIFGFTD